MRYCKAVLFVVLGFAVGARAQSSPPQHQHNIVSPNVIDGAVHPELIPDSIAYRLYLEAVSTRSNPTEDETKHQHAHLMKTGLDDIDQRMLVSVLSDFRAKYDSLVANYNASAKEANAHNETTDIHILLSKLHDLVQSTRDAISVRLSSEGAAKLHAFIVSEKKNMKMVEGQ